MQGSSNLNKSYAVKIADGSGRPLSGEFVGAYPSAHDAGQAILALAIKAFLDPNMRVIKIEDLGMEEKGSSGGLP